MIADILDQTVRDQIRRRATFGRYVGESREEIRRGVLTGTAMSTTAPDHSIEQEALVAAYGQRFDEVYEDVASDPGIYTGTSGDVASRARSLVAGLVAENAGEGMAKEEVHALLISTVGRSARVYLDQFEGVWSEYVRNRPFH